MNNLVKSYRQHTLILLLLALYFSLAVNAQETSKIEIQNDEVAYLTCDKSKLNERNSQFTEIDQIIKDMAVSECKGKFEDRKKYSQLVVAQINKKIGSFKGVSLFTETWSSYVNQGRQLSFKSITNGIGGPTKLEIVADNLPFENQNISITFDDVDKCKKVKVSDVSKPFLSCQKVSESLETSLDTLNVFRNDDRYSEIAKHVNFIEGEWKSFMEESRFQTSLDVWATTLMYSDKWKHADLQGPPPIQYFLLHPTLVYSYMPDASRGEEAKPVPAIELFGMNWWRNKLPLGFSVTSVYNDRPEGKAFPIGLTIHVDNTYSFGVVGTGDDQMIFFNLDVMAWFSDKKGKYDKYEKEFDEYRKGLK